jgi:hypothetical protein
MEAMTVVMAAAFSAFHRPQNRRWTRSALAVAVVAAVAFSAGAVQLFASVEYGRLALRWIGAAGAVPATEKIPYAWFTDYYWPQGLLGMLIPRIFGGQLGPGGPMPAYVGVFPFLAALIGIWKCWNRPWVRYLTGLAVAGVGLALGPLSLLHGLAYALVPGLWIAREADRFIFLTCFALAVLAAFGVEALLTAPAPALKRPLLGIILACATALAIPAVFGQPAIGPKVSLSILLIAASCGLLLYLARGGAGLVAKAIVVALILFDLGAFYFPAVNKREATAKGANEWDRLLGMRGAVAFLKSQPGLFRVQVAADPRPNPGDAFEIQTLLGAGVTMVKDYAEIHSHADLLNARYILRPASAVEPGAIYQDTAWKVYENPAAYPRAWIVHEAAAGKLGEAAVDTRKVALLDAPLASQLGPADPSAPEDATVTAYEASRMELSVRTGTPAMLVLSETFYPGWKATVNGRPARIYKVDGDLRGIVVPSGASRVALRYAPASILVGGILTLATFAAGLVVAILLVRP